MVCRILGMYKCMCMYAYLTEHIDFSVIFRLRDSQLKILM